MDLQRCRRAPAAPPWPAYLSAEDDTEAINDWIYQANLEQPLEEVLATYSQSFQQMRDAVTALTERNLTERGRYDWLGGEPLEAVIMASFGHLHEEHEPALRAWLAQSEAL